MNESEEELIKKNKELWDIINKNEQEIKDQRKQAQQELWEFVKDKLYKADNTEIIERTEKKFGLK